MTLITGAEPKHWHRREDGAVRHDVTDPRRYRGYPQRLWTKDERSYVQHLEAHEAAATSSLEPTNTDHELVRTYLGYIAEESGRLRVVRELTLVLRHELATGVSIDASEAANALRALLPDSAGGLIIDPPQAPGLGAGMPHEPTGAASA